MDDIARFPDLSDASVFITGGGSGIGAALTEGFLRQGARVAFVGRSDYSEFAGRMAAETGRRPLALRADIADIAALRAALAQAAEAHGAISVLVNNAADDTRHSTLEVDEAFYERCMAINFKAYFFAAQGVIPGMQAAGGGSIVNMTSVSYMMGNAGYPLYAAANSGLNGLTRSLAREFGPDGIRVNALVPGWVMTDKQREMWVTEEGLSAHLSRQCLPEPLVPHDIVGGALFLASAASAMMTGQALVIDGGVVTTG